MTAEYTNRIVHITAHLITNITTVEQPPMSKQNQSTNREEYTDTIYTTHTVHVSFWDRIRVLFGSTIRIDHEQKIAVVYDKESNSFLPMTITSNSTSTKTNKLITRKSKGEGYAEQGAEATISFAQLQLTTAELEELGFLQDKWDFTQSIEVWNGVYFVNVQNPGVRTIYKKPLTEAYFVYDPSGTPCKWYHCFHTNEGKPCHMLLNIKTKERLFELLD